MPFVGSVSGCFVVEDVVGFVVPAENEVTISHDSKVLNIHKVLTLNHLTSETFAG